MVFATFSHVHFPNCMVFAVFAIFAICWHVHVPFCMAFSTFRHVHLPFCRVFATFLVLQPVILFKIYFGLVYGCVLVWFDAYLGCKDWLGRHIRFIWDVHRVYCFWSCLFPRASERKVLLIPLWCPLEGLYTQRQSNFKNKTEGTEPCREIKKKPMYA